MYAATKIILKEYGTQRDLLLFKTFCFDYRFCESFPRLSLKLQILYKGESGGNEVRTGCSKFLI